HRAAKIVELACGNIIAPCFDMAAHAELLEQRHRAGGVLAIVLLAGTGHGKDKSFHIGHRLSPLFVTLLLLQGGLFYFPTGPASSRNAASCAFSARSKAGRSRQRAREASSARCSAIAPLAIPSRSTVAIAISATLKSPAR